MGREVGSHGSNMPAYGDAYTFTHKVYEVVSNASKAVLTIAIRAMGNSTYAASKVFNPNAVRCISGLAFIGARCAHGLSKGIENLNTDKITDAVTETIGVVQKNVVDTTQETREATLGTLGSMATTIPVVGPGMGIAIRAWNELEKTNLTVAQQHSNIFLKTFNVTAKVAARSGKAFLSSTIKTASDWLSKRLYAVYEDPESLQSALLETSASLYSTANKVEKNLEQYLQKLNNANEGTAHANKETLIALEILTLEEEILSGTLPSLTPEKFLQYSPEKQYAIIEILEKSNILLKTTPTRKEVRNNPQKYWGGQAPSSLPTGKKYRAFLRKYQKHKELAKEDIGIVYNIARLHNTLREKELIPEELKQLDELDKIKVIFLVKKDLPLTDQWHTLFKETPLTKRGDFDAFIKSRKDRSQLFQHDPSKV